MADSATEAPKKATTKKRPRIHMLDELRGFAIFCMVFYHAFYTIGIFFGIKWGEWLLNFFTPAEPYFAGLFIFISGISSNLSHSNLERGVKLAGIALGVTLVTYLALGQNNMIVFGVLHMLAAGMILFGLFGKYLKIIPTWLGIILSLLIFIFSFNIATKHTVGIPFLFDLRVPAQWYTTKFLFMFGLPYSGFQSSDYFPIIPWIFIFFAGTFFGRLAREKKFPKFMYKKHIGFFAFLGRHSLIIYLAHQPVIFGIFYSIQWAISFLPNLAH